MKADKIKPWIRDLEPYSPGKTIEGTIKLASNENNYGPSPKVIEGLKARVGEIYRYPYKDAKVKGALAKYCNVKADNIVLGNGSDELIDLVVKTFNGPVASHYPTFVEYRAFTQILGGQYICIQLGEGFKFDADTFIKESENANLLFLCTPNNPTGTVIGLEDILKVAGTGKITVVDEAYYEFCGETAACLIQDYDNIIVLRTMAKAFGLAGLRIGYAIAGEDAARALEAVKPPFNVNYLAHEAAVLALSDIEYMRETVGKIKKDRDLLYAKLSAKYKAIPSESNFVLVDVSPMSSDEFFDKMLKEKIVVRNMGRFEGFEGQWIRINLGTEEEDKKLFEALDKISG